MRPAIIALVLTLPAAAQPADLHSALDAVRDAAHAPAAVSDKYSSLALHPPVPVS